MKRLFFGLFITLISAKAYAGDITYSPDSDVGDTMTVCAFDTDIHDCIPMFRVTNGSAPFGNLSASVLLDGVSLIDRLSAKQNSSSAFSGVYNDLSAKPTIPTTFDQLSDGSTNKAFTATLLSKLNGVASGATANDTDANLKNRANHTGTQLSTTISDWTEASQDAVAGAMTSEFSYNDAGNSIGLRAKSFTNSPSTKTIQTVAAAANGFQVSSTRDATIIYSVTVSSAVQIGLATNVSGYVVLEVSATNSSTAGDWQEISRCGTGQNIGLAIALSSTQTVSCPVSGSVQAGYYARLRSINVSGTPTYAYNSGQEVLQ